MYTFHLKIIQAGQILHSKINQPTTTQCILQEWIAIWTERTDDSTCLIIWGPHITGFIPHIIWLFLSRVTAFLPSQCTLINALLKYCVQYFIYKRDLKRRHSSSVLCHIRTPSHPKKMGWKECHCSPDTPDIHPLLPIPLVHWSFNLRIKPYNTPASTSVYEKLLPSHIIQSG
jgi:hypothetical protein